MILIGPNRSPFVRRVAITLHAYGLPYEQQSVTGFSDREAVRARNPLGRIPALVLDDGETLVDSSAIVDHLDEVVGAARALTPPEGADRRAVLRVAALMMGACDKGAHAFYELHRRPGEKVHRPWVDDCLAQVRAALNAIEDMLPAHQDAGWLLCGRLTQADITAFVAERFARAMLELDTAHEQPRLHRHAKRLEDEPSFRGTEP